MQTTDAPVAPDNFYIRLKISKEIPDAEIEEPFITEIAATITHYDNGDRLVGKLKAYFVDSTRAEEDGCSLFEILDWHSNELEEMHKLFRKRVYLGDPPFSKAMMTALGHGYAEHLVYFDFVAISRLEILPKYRGKGIGIWSLREVLRYLAYSFKANYFVMKPFPLQGELSDRVASSAWQKRMKLEAFDSNMDAATSRLRQLYAQLGFTLVKGTDFMVASIFKFRED